VLRNDQATDCGFTDTGGSIYHVSTLETFFNAAKEGLRKTWMIVMPHTIIAVVGTVAA
jgi:hypothetical protein